jgi:hypothetical protein
MVGTDRGLPFDPDEPDRDDRQSEGGSSFRPRPSVPRPQARRGLAGDLPTSAAARGSSNELDFFIAQYAASQGGEKGLALVVFRSFGAGDQSSPMGVAVLVFPPPSYRGVVGRSLWVADSPRQLRRGITEELSKAIADRTTRPEWDAITVKWDVTDFGGFNSAGDLVQNLETWEHHRVGQWFSQVGSAAGLPTSLTGGAGDVLGLAVPLPGEHFLDQLSTVIHLAGVAFAVASGNPALACASLKSLAHTAMIDIVSTELQATLTPAPQLDPPAGPDPGSPDAPPGPTFGF